MINEKNQKWKKVNKIVKINNAQLFSILKSFLIPNITKSMFKTRKPVNKTQAVWKYVTLELLYKTI